MRIAFFVRSMVNGGAEKVAAQLTCMWARLGHKTVLLTEFPSSEGEGRNCEYVAREFVGNDASVVPQKLEDLHARYHFEAAVFNDAINSEWFEGTLIAAKVMGLRTVVINHHTANNWMYGCCNTKELFMDDVLSKADAMVCVDRMWALWWKYRGVESVFIQNPVSVGEMRDEKRGKRASLTLVNNIEEAVERLKGKKNVIWIGRIGDALKRPELAIEVFKKVASDKSDAKMVMLGNSDKDIKRRLLRNVPARIREKISFPGFVENVAEYIANADAHLFTSATEVTVPQVVLETLTAGVDTVAFDQPVLRECPIENDVAEIEGKWRKVLAGDDVECDFGMSEVLQCLMDELHRSQQWFATHHLSELKGMRSLLKRANPLYIVKRIVQKIKFC